MTIKQIGHAVASYSRPLLRDLVFVLGFEEIFFMLQRARHGERPRVETDPFYLGVDLMRMLAVVSYGMGLWHMWRMDGRHWPWLGAWVVAGLYVAGWDWWWGYSGSFPARTRLGAWARRHQERWFPVWKDRR